LIVPLKVKKEDSLILSNKAEIFEIFTEPEQIENLDGKDFLRDENSCSFASAIATPFEEDIFPTEI